MKKIIIFIAGLSLIFALRTINCAAQTWQWSDQIGSPDNDGGGAMISDNNGNLYISGNFTGSPCYFNTDTLIRYGSNSCFFMKFDNSGNELWIKRFLGGLSSSSSVLGICFDTINNFIYITGIYSGEVNLGCDTLNGSGSINFFLAKFDTDGNCVWAKQATGIADSYGDGVAVDINGNVYVCGQNFGSITLGSYSIQKGSFIAKYDSDGNCLWAKKKFRPSEIAPKGIKIFDSTILIAGIAANDTIVVDTITVLNHGYGSAFISAFDIDGNAKWLKLDGGPYGYSGYDFSIDNLGNSFLCGYWGNIGYFGSDTLTNTPGTVEDAFIAKYTINGSLQWVRQLHSSGGAEGTNISTTKDGTSYLTGFFKGNASFGTFNISASTSQDMFVAKYDSSGACLGVTHFGKANGMAVYANDNGSFWVEGQFKNSVTIGGNSFTSHGDNDIFVAKGTLLTGVETRSLKNNKNQLVIYANPMKGTCNLTIPDELMQEEELVLRIFDMGGKLIQQSPVQVNEGKVIVNIEAEAKGIYNVVLTNGKKSYSGRIVFE